MKKKYLINISIKGHIERLYLNNIFVMALPYLEKIEFWIDFKGFWNYILSLLESERK